VLFFINVCSRQQQKKKECLSTIMHQAIYRIKYGYSFSRTPRSGEFPMLLDCCSWMICSGLSTRQTFYLIVWRSLTNVDFQDDPLYQTTQLVDVFSEDIRERVEATKLLQPMWGIKSVPDQTDNDYSASASSTYFSLEALIKFNSLWLSKPLNSSPITSSNSMASFFSRMSLSSQPIPAHDCTAPIDATFARFQTHGIPADSTTSNTSVHDRFANHLSHSTNCITTHPSTVQQTIPTTLTGSENCIDVLGDSLRSAPLQTNLIEVIPRSDSNSPTSETLLISSSSASSIVQSSSLSIQNRAHDCSQPP